MTEDGTKQPIEENTLCSRMQMLWDKLRELPSLLNFVHEVAKWMQSIATISAFAVFLVYLCYDEFGKYLYRSVNLDRHWFYVGHYDTKAKSWFKENGKTPIAPFLESGDGNARVEFKDGWFWGESFNHGEVMLASHPTGAVGRSGTSDSDTISGHAKRLIECIYINDSEVTKVKDNLKKVWVYGIVWEC